MTGDVDAKTLRKVLSKYALPSAKELQQLNAADPTNAYRTSFFRLQVDELLLAVKQAPINKSMNGLQTLLFEIKEFVSQLPAQHVSQDALNMDGICIRNHIKRKDIFLAFEKPSRLDIVGNFILKNTVYSKSIGSEYNQLTVDIAVEIPASCILPKDFSNYRYFDKRNMYIGTLAAELQTQTSIFDSVKLTSFCGDHEKPTVICYVSSTAMKTRDIHLRTLCLRFIPVLTTDVFKLSKLAPSKNNIRHERDMTEDDMMGCQTPYYNNSILEDMVLRQHTRDLHAVISASPSFLEACILVKIWLRQRMFHRSLDSMNGFLGNMLLLYLYTQKRFTVATPSDQMFKVFVQFLASHNIKSRPLQFPPAEGGVTLTSEGLRVFQNSFDTVFLDSSGRYNLFGRLSKSAWFELQRAASESVHLLQVGSLVAFNKLFIQKHTFWTRYDQYFWFPAPMPVDLANNNIYSRDDKRMVNDIGLDRFWLRKIESIVTQALSDRVFCVRACVSEALTNNEWELHSRKVSDVEIDNHSTLGNITRKIAIGIQINPEKAQRIVDKGPSADDKVGSAHFRQFWGEKAELRRFKDGTIVEAVVWDGLPTESRHRLLEVIVKHIVVQHFPHFPTIANQIRTSNATLYNLLDEEYIGNINTIMRNSPQSLRSGGSNFESNMTAVSELLVVYNGVVKTLRDMKSLPLKLSDILQVHSAFRYTSLTGIEPHPLAYSKNQSVCAIRQNCVGTVLEPLVSKIIFERSSAWPQSKEALEHAKVGFYVQMAHELSTQHNWRCEVAMNGLDIFLSGYVFRFIIQCERELNILAGLRPIGFKQLTTLASTKYIQLKRELEYLPKHATAIQALHSKNISFGPTVRLSHRWIASQYMSNCLCLEAIELLVAHVFINTTATSIPHSILSGFIRFLELLSKHDWKNAPLIVALTGNISSHDDMYHEIHRTFQASSTLSLSTHPPMFIAADYESLDCLSSWTRSTPQSVVLHRLTSCAAAAYNTMTKWLANGASSTGWKSAFFTNIADFDAILSLNVRLLPMKPHQIQQHINSLPKKSPFLATIYKNMDLTKIPVMIGFDPVSQFLQDLERKFDHFALFFIDQVQQSEILIKWKPDAFFPVKFRAIASKGLNVLPHSDSTKNEPMIEQIPVPASPSIGEILAEIKILGEGIILDVKLAPFKAASIENREFNSE